MLFLFICFISFLIGFRGEDVGTDTYSYMFIYDDIISNGYSGFPEPLYGVFCLISGLAGMSFQVSQTFMTFMALSFTFAAIKKQSLNYSLSAFLMISMYFVFYAMNIYREMMACFIVIYGCVILSDENEKHNVLKFLLVVAVSVGFHYSSVLMLLLILLRKFQMKDTYILWGFLLSILLGIIDITNSLSSLMGGYASYLEKEQYVRGGAKLLMAFSLSAYWSLGFFYMYKNSDANFRNSLYMKMFFLGILIFNLLVRQDLGLRLILYFLYPLIIGIPLFIYTQNNILKNQIMVILYTSLYFVVFSISDSADVIPYRID